jgi:hypothetical protein
MALFTVQYRVLLTCVSLISLLMIVSIVFGVLATYSAMATIALLALVLGIILASSGLWQKFKLGYTPLKFQFDGIVQEDGKTSHYGIDDNGKSNLLDLGSKLPDQFFAADLLDGETRSAERTLLSHRVSAPESAAPPKDAIDPEAALLSWLSRCERDGKNRPKLVVIATSGGAYRAAFWTGLVLDKLSELERDPENPLEDGPLKGFCRNVRLITGASGGMVGAAYFAALAQEDGSPTPSVIRQLSDDILQIQLPDSPVSKERQENWEAWEANNGVGPLERGGPPYPYQTQFALPRDSLSAIAQQLVSQDFTTLFRSGPFEVDRGVVLEDQWHTLDITFQTLYEGERDGWRPSILFSPMLVETGQPMFIGNLSVSKTVSQPRNLSVSEIIFEIEKRRKADPEILKLDLDPIGMTVEDHLVELADTLKKLRELDAATLLDDIASSDLRDMVHTTNPSEKGQTIPTYVKERVAHSLSERFVQQEYYDNVEFFRWFKGARNSFKVKTAVRMNAAFPYIAPSTALPTAPYMRVVDAGYYDNYGIDAAVAYLSRENIRKLILSKCSGVALIEIRAFPEKRVSRDNPGLLSRAFQFVTTPLSAALSARSSTMTFRNRQSFERLCQTYNIAYDSREFVQNFRFEVDSSTSLSWYLPSEELQEMGDFLDSPLNRESLERLKAFW